MSAGPLLRNDREAGEAIGVTDVLLAAAIAWAVPIALGGGILAADMILFREGGPATALTGAAVVLLFSAALSWTGLVPGALILLGLIRLGWGGIGPALAIGAALAWSVTFTLLPDTPGGVLLIGTFGALLSGVTWLALKIRRPAALTA